MNREEALQEVAKRDWWPTPFVSVNKRWKAPEGWVWVEYDGYWRLINTSGLTIGISEWQYARNGIVVSTPTADPAPAPNKYQRTVPSTTIDVYDVLTAYSVTNPATQHAIKKLLQPGNRGHKDTLTDLREALASIRRAIQIEEQSCQQ